MELWPLIYVTVLHALSLTQANVSVKHPVCALKASAAGRCAYLRWSYIAERKQCIPFIYSGCGGTANNFMSIEECEAKCDPGTN